ncbi:MAG: nuclear transport factor 2 family protein [Candidatus Acidiferrales bacterium]
MRKILLSMLLAISSVGLLKADDIMMTGAKAEKVKKEIVDLNHEKHKTLLDGPAAADFIDRHEVDSILYLGSNLRTNMTKAQVVNEWRTGARKMSAENVHDERVRVYDNGNVAVLDYISDNAPKVQGENLKRSNHVLEVYVRHNGVWRTVVHDSFATAGDKKPE